MTGIISDIYVPNVGPKDAKIIFVGEAPGQDEARERQPFIGESGNKLMTCLGRNGLSREEVILANLCHYRPPGNSFRALVGTPQLADGLSELRELIRSVRPNVVVPLGAWPLYYLTGKFGKNPGSGILNWRGSILRCSMEGLDDIKVIPTVHPAAILRDGSLYPTFDIDIRRAKGDSAFPELRLPERELYVVKSGDEAIEWAERLSQSSRLAVDIETFGRDLACVGFAPNSSCAVCFVWSSDWAIRDSVIRLLESSIPKTFHFGTFDTEFLHSLCNLRAVNWAWDTMVAQHVMEPELPRSLAYLTSVYTREPYYKDERKEGAKDKKSWGKKTDREKLWKYNCKDCCVTAEIQELQEKELEEGPQSWREFFDFEMEEVSQVAQHISRSGMLRDERRRLAIQIVLVKELAERQEVLGYASGFKINANSPPQVAHYVYDVINLPVRRNRKTGKRTVDEDAMVSLLSYCEGKINEVKKEETKKEWRKKALSIKLVLLVRQNRKALSSYVLIASSEDGRVRSTYKVPGADTARWSAEKYVDKTGCNSQTFPREPLEIDEEEWKKIEATIPDLGVQNEGLVEVKDDDDEDEEDFDEIDDDSSEGESAA